MRYPTWKRYPTSRWFGIGLLIAVLFFAGAIAVMGLTDDAVNDHQTKEIEDRPDTTDHVDTLSLAPITDQALAFTITSGHPTIEAYYGVTM